MFSSCFGQPVVPGGQPVVSSMRPVVECGWMSLFGTGELIPGVIPFGEGGMMLRAVTAVLLLPGAN